MAIPRGAVHAESQISGCHGGALVHGVWRKRDDLCVKGTLRPGAYARFRWLHLSKRAIQPLFFNLQGTSGAVTAVDVFEDTGSSSVDRPVYSLVDKGTSGGIGDVVLLPAGHYIVELSCGHACTTGGDDFRLELSAAVPADPSRYGSEVEPDNTDAEAQQVESDFVRDGNLGNSEDYYAWHVSRNDAKQCWQIALMLSADAHGWMKLFDAHGRMLAERDADNRSAGWTGLLHLGVAAGTYFVRVGPRHGQPVPYRLSARPAGLRDPNTQKGTTVTGCEAGGGDY